MSIKSFLSQSAPSANESSKSIPSSAFKRGNNEKIMLRTPEILISNSPYPVAKPVPPDLLRKPDIERISKLANPRKQSMKFFELKKLIDCDIERQHEKWLRQTQGMATARVGELAVPFPNTIKTTKSQFCSVMNDYHYNNLTDAYTKSVYIYGEPLDNVNYKRPAMIEHPSFNKLKSKCDTFYTRYRKQTKLFQQQAANNILAHIEKTMQSKNMMPSQNTRQSHNTMLSENKMQSQNNLDGEKKSSEENLKTAPGPQRYAVNNDPIKLSIDSHTSSLAKTLVESKSKQQEKQLSDPTIKTKSISIHEVIKQEESKIDKGDANHEKRKPKLKKSSLTIIKQETKEAIAGTPTSQEHVGYGKHKTKRRRHEQQSPKTNALNNLLNKWFSKSNKNKSSSPRDNSKKPRGEKQTVMQVGMPSSNDIKRLRLSDSTKKSLLMLSAKDPEYFRKFFQTNKATLADRRPMHTGDSLEEMDKQIHLLSQHLNEVSRLEGTMKNEEKSCCYNNQDILLPSNPLTSRNSDFLNQIIHLDNVIPPVSSNCAVTPEISEIFVNKNIRGQANSHNYTKTKSTVDPMNKISKRTLKHSEISKFNGTHGHSNINNALKKLNIYNSTAQSDKVIPNGKNVKTTIIKKDSESSSATSNESDCDDDPVEFKGLDKKEMLLRMAVEDEIFAIRRKMADIRRERTFARLAKPRAVTAKLVDRVESAPEVNSHRKTKMWVQSERINQLAVPRYFRETVKRDSKDKMISTSKRFELRRENRAEQLGAIRNDRMKLAESFRMHDRYQHHVPDDKFAKFGNRIEVGEATILKETASDTVIRLAVYIND